MILQRIAFMMLFKQQTMDEMFDSFVSQFMYGCPFCSAPFVPSLSLISSPYSN